MWMNKANKVQVGQKSSERGRQVRTDHQVPNVCVRGDGWKPKKESQFVQEKDRVVMVVLMLRVSLQRRRG